jgi:hypothetical protein
MLFKEILSFSWNADRAPQLKAGVVLLLASEDESW